MIPALRIHLIQPAYHDRLDRDLASWGRRKRNAWTGGQIRTLRRLWAKVPNAELERRLGHSFKGCQSQMQSWFGYSRLRSDDFLTMVTVLDIMGTHREAVNRWVEDGLLLAERFGRRGKLSRGEWRISPAALIEFIREYPMAYDGRRILTEPYRTEALKIYQARPYHTAAEASRLLKVKVETVWHWMIDGKIPFSRHRSMGRVIYGSDLRPPHMIRPDCSPRDELVRTAMSLRGMVWSRDAAGSLGVCASRVRQMVRLGDADGYLVRVGHQTYSGVTKSWLNAELADRECRTIPLQEVSIPADVLRRTDVNDAAKLVYGVVQTISGGDKIKISVNALCPVLGYSAQKVQRALDTLIRAGLIERPTRHSIKPKILDSRKAG